MGFSSSMRATSSTVTTAKSFALLASTARSATPGRAARLRTLPGCRQRAMEAQLAAGGVPAAAQPPIIAMVEGQSFTADQHIILTACVGGGEEDVTANG